MIFEWHQSALQRVLLNRDKLAHALLLTGPAGTGKREFALGLSRVLLCRSPGSDGTAACGTCHACQLLDAGTHPDLMLVELEMIEPDKSAKDIKIDQIRSLCGRLYQTSQFGGLKIAIINPADAMNRNAANSLLKSLEEPPADTLLMLLSAQPSFLPATIRSRCQFVRLSPPTHEQSIAWLSRQYPDADARALLAAGGGAPKVAAIIADNGLLSWRHEQFFALKAVAEQRQQPLSLAGQWIKAQKAHMGLILNWWLGWVSDIITLRMAGQQAITNTDMEKDLQALSMRIDLRKLFEFRTELQQAVRMLGGSINIQLLLENLLLQWGRITASQQS